MNEWIDKATGFNFKEYEQIINAYARKYQNILGEDFDDLVQEARLALIIGFSKFDKSKGKEKTFVIKLIKNKLNGLYSEKKRLKANPHNIDHELIPLWSLDREVSDEDGSTLFIDTLDSYCDDPCNVMIMSELLQEFINYLKEYYDKTKCKSDKEVIEIFFEQGDVKGINVKEIAKKLKVTPQCIYGMRSLMKRKFNEICFQH